MTYRYCFSASAKSPTSLNLAAHLQRQGWRQTRFQWRAHFSDQHLQFPPAVAEQLESKHLLAELCQQYCPGLMPVTYTIHDHNWQVVLNQVQSEHPTDCHWILKPSLLNNGQHIKIFQDVEAIQRHYQTNQRMGGEHVLQHYLRASHLIEGPKQQQHKYSIRQFVVMANFKDYYLHPLGYFNVAKHPYQPGNYQDLRSHLTNEHLCELDANVIQIPTDQFTYMPQLAVQISQQISAVMTAMKTKFPAAFAATDEPRIALLGFDFMVDAELRTWLIEVNHGPCFPTTDDHPLQRYLYEDFWQAVIQRFVMPILSVAHC